MTMLPARHRTHFIDSPIRLAVSALAVATALGACGNATPEDFSSTLQTPPGPGDGYSLVRSGNQDHEILQVTVAGNYLFFMTSWRGVFRVPKYGGAVEGVDVDGNAQDLALTSHDDQVYWVKAKFGQNDVPTEWLERSASTGGSIATLETGNLRIISINGGNNLTADASHVYLLGEGFVEATPIAGGTSTHLPFPWDSGGFPYGQTSFQADYPFVYLSSCAADSSCSLVETDLSTGAARPMVGALTRYAFVGAIDDGAIYVTEDGTISSVSRADATRTMLYSGGAASILVDAEDIYFVTYVADGGPSGAASTQLMSMPKAGGPTTVIGTDLRLSHGVWDLAQDDDFVFVVTAAQFDSGNEILAFPKRPPAN